MYVQKLASWSVNEVKSVVSQIFLYLAIVPLEIMFPAYDDVCTGKFLITCVVQTSRVCGASLQPWCSRHAQKALPYGFQERWVHIPLQLSSINAPGNHKFRPTVVTISGPTTSMPEPFTLHTRTFLPYKSDFLVVTSAMSPTWNPRRYHWRLSYGINCQGSTGTGNCFKHQ